ncbi:amino acid permease [Mycoplasmopsis cynos]|uniref:APC family permease n=1 Tax=Mycoplasmopsis cynos TaxID=171284 RepID=UPI002205DDEE|nr:amino acid permease [Mycoplasmopsis cynos]UWV80762.1 amino acid permease [Mycoplasmopsis cynos]
MNKERKIGLFLSMAMIIGSVVGIGIFFKNASISNAVSGDGLSWLIAWILGGIISISAAISFAEIGSFKDGRLSGLSNWVFKVTKNKHLAYHTSISYTIFYWGILNAIIGIFASEALFYFFVLVNVVEYNSIKIWMYVIVGFVLTSFFIGLNFVSVKISSKFQFIISIIKFIPLIFALIIGIIFPNTHYVENAGNGFLKNAFTVKGIIVALPAILFSYDAFLISGSITNKTKNPTKTLPRAILLGMIIIVILYSLISISSILHSQGVVHNLISDVFPKKYSNKISAIIMFFIFLSALGVINGLTSAFINELQMLIKNKLLFGSKRLLHKFKEEVVFIIYLSIIKIFYLLTIILPSILLNTDVIIDAISNFPTVFFFIVYGTLIFSYLLNRNKISETKKINNALFYVFSIIAIFGIILMEGAYLYLQFEAISTIKENPFGWGVFWGGEGSKLISSWTPLVIYLVMLFYFILVPWINYYLEKKIFKFNFIKEVDFNEIEICNATHMK